MTPIVLPRGKRILFVDDSAPMCEMVALALRAHGCEVETAGDGVTGLRLFGTAEWDVVVTDQVMPVMDGEALAAAIRERSAPQAIVLISGALSAVKKPELFDARLAKPFTVRKLLECIASVCPIAAS